MKTLRYTTLFIIHFALALGVCAQRADNRRLVWTGSSGMEWSDASWKTSGAWLAYANSNSTSAVWLSGTALNDAQFLAGDVAIFDSASDYNPSGDPADTRVINVASAGVTASDVILSGAGSFVFTGGAITTDAAAVVPGSTQVTGTGFDGSLAYQNISPAGRLVKVNTGDLTLSSTVANDFKGGIHLGAGSLTIADNRALGGNNISILPASTATANNIMLPAIVTGADNLLLRAGTALISPVTLRVPASAAGLDITGDIYLANQMLTFDIEGDTTISGRIHGASDQYGSNGGYFTKTGNGTLMLTGTDNWFYSTTRYSIIESGRIVIISPFGIGSGAVSVNPGATLEFRGVNGIMKQSFIGGGDIEITQGSDLAFSWRNGPLEDYENTVSYAAAQPAYNSIGTLSITGASRFTAIASGTYASVLGGGSVQVFVRGNSTLVLGRGGITGIGAASTGLLPIDYPIYASRVSLSGASTLILNPNANLNTVMLDVSEDSVISFGASGVSRIRWSDGTTPAELEDPNRYRYRTPEGMTLIINEMPVTGGYHREYVVVNHGANPLKDIAMTLGALDALHDTLSARLADNFLDPVAPLVPARKRQWVSGAWTRYIASQFDYDNVSITTPGIDGRIGGIVLGFESILPGRVLLGVHAGAIANNMSTTNDTSLTSQQRFIGIHAAQRFGRLHLAASAATGRVRTDSLRNEPANLVRGKWNTTYYSASLEAGATFTPLGKTVIRPFAGLRYTTLKLHDYYERGPSPLLVGDFHDNGVQVVAGVSGGRKFTVLKRELSVDLRIARKRIVAAPRATLGTHYSDSPDTPITLERGDYYADVTAVGVSARWAVSRHTLAGLAIDHDTASTHTRSTITGMVGYTW